MADTKQYGLPNIGPELAAQKEAGIERQYLAQGGYSPWINLLGTWSGVPNAVEAARPKVAPPPQMSLADRIFLEQEKQKGRESLMNSKLAQEKPDKTPEFRYKAANFYKRLQDSESDLNRLNEAGFDPTSISTAAQLKSPTSLFQSGETQQYQQLMDNFINAVLRRESGAAIANSEYDKAYKQYFPRAGDTKDVLAQKARNRKDVSDTLKAEAGSALDQVQSSTPEAPTYGVYQGKTYKKRADGNWELIE
jgi:hypothetical protein